MFAATDTPWAPWHVVRSDDKKRARLNTISHLLASVEYQELKQDKVVLPKRKIGKTYTAQSICLYAAGLPKSHPALNSAVAYLEQRRWAGSPSARLRPELFHGYRSTHRHDC